MVKYWTIWIWRVFRGFLLTRQSNTSRRRLKCHLMRLPKTDACKWCHFIHYLCFLEISAEKWEFAQIRNKFSRWRAAPAYTPHTRPDIINYATVRSFLPYSPGWKWRRKMGCNAVPVDLKPRETHPCGGSTRQRCRYKQTSVQYLYSGRGEALY